MISVVLLNLVSITYKCRLEVAIDDEIEDTAEEEEDDLDETTHITEELKHTTDRSVIHSLGGVSTEVDLYVILLRGVDRVVSAKLPIELKELGLSRCGDKFEWIVVRYKLALLIEEVKRPGYLTVDLEPV